MDTTGTLCTAGGGSSATFGAAFPATGTASGFEYVSPVPSLSSGDMYPGFLTAYGDLAVDTPTTNNNLYAAISSPPNVYVSAVATALTGHTVGGNTAMDVNVNSINGTAASQDPCQNNFANQAYALINTTSSAAIITGTSAKKTYVCAVNLVASAADNVAMVEGTTVSTPCDTGTAGVAGGTTAATGWNFTSNGLALGNGLGTVLRAAHTAADNVCLLVSGVAQVSGSITYVQQ